MAESRLQDLDSHYKIMGALGGNRIDNTQAGQLLIENVKKNCEPYACVFELLRPNLFETLRQEDKEFLASFILETTRTGMPADRSWDFSNEFVWKLYSKILTHKQVAQTLSESIRRKNSPNILRNVNYFESRKLLESLDATEREILAASILNKVESGTITLGPETLHVFIKKGLLLQGDVVDSFAKAAHAGYFVEENQHVVNSLQFRRPFLPIDRNFGLPSQWRGSQNGGVESSAPKPNSAGL